MTLENQRIVIAEACGWKRTDTPTYQNWGENARTKEWWYVHQLPDYLNDLNDMHEAENSLPTEDRIKYTRLLNEVTGHPVEGGNSWYLCHATAPQRAMTFLKTIGKWRDE